MDSPRPCRTTLSPSAIRFSTCMVSPFSSWAPRGARTFSTNSCLPLNTPENLVEPIRVKLTSSAKVLKKASAFPFESSANIFLMVSLFSAAPMISSCEIFFSGRTVRRMTKGCQDETIDSTDPTDQPTVRGIVHASQSTITFIVASRPPWSGCDGSGKPKWSASTCARCLSSAGEC